VNGERNKMKNETTLRIIEIGDGRWKFDIKAGMNDDEIRRLLGRIKYIENELMNHMKTELVKITEAIEVIKAKDSTKS
jgi:hypothetical protein